MMMMLSITFMQGIYNYTPETNHVSGVYIVAAVLYLQFVLHVTLFFPLNMFYLLLLLLLLLLLIFIITIVSVTARPLRFCRLYGYSNSFLSNKTFISKVYKYQIYKITSEKIINLLKPTSHVTHQQFNNQQLYSLPTLYLCVFYLSEIKQRLVPLTA